MQTLSLDPKFLIGDLNVNIFKFSGGECHIKLGDVKLQDDIRIVHRVNSSDNLMELLLAADALRGLNPQVNLHAFIPYFPYARQDRRVVRGEPFSLQVFINVLKSANFNSAGLLDAHSNITFELLEESNIPHYSILPGYLRRARDEIIKKFGNFVIVAPDKGAKIKIFETAKYIDYIGKIYCADKVRDGNTGNITGMSLDCEDGELDEKVAWVQDDICDGGKTFIEIAKILRDKGCKNVILSVSHGIFSKGEEELAKWIDMIYTTNSIKDDESNLIKRFKT